MPLRIPARQVPTSGSRPWPQDLTADQFTPARHLVVRQGPGTGPRRRHQRPDHALALAARSLASIPLAEAAAIAGAPVRTLAIEDRSPRTLGRGAAVDPGRRAARARESSPACLARSLTTASSTRPRRSRGVSCAPSTTGCGDWKTGSPATPPVPADSRRAGTGRRAKQPTAQALSIASCHEARPRRNGSDSLAYQRPRPSKVLPPKLSHPRTAKIARLALAAIGKCSWCASRQAPRSQDLSFRHCRHSGLEAARGARRTLLGPPLA